MTPFLAFTLPWKMLGISCRALNELLYRVEAWHSCKLLNFDQAVVSSKPLQFLNCSSSEQLLFANFKSLKLHKFVKSELC